MILENGITQLLLFLASLFIQTRSHNDLSTINHCHTTINDALALTIYSAAKDGAAG